MAEKKAKVAGSNRTRAESMALLEDATMNLLLTNNPHALTVREIAEVAGVHFRYIPDYFGGKAELYASIYSRVAEEAADGLQFPFAAAVVDGVDPKIIRHAHLATWLSSNHPTGVPVSDRPIQRQLEQILTGQFGIGSATAAIVAERLIALVIVLAAYPDVVSPNPINIRAHIELELKMLAAIAEK